MLAGNGSPRRAFVRRRMWRPVHCAVSQGHPDARLLRDERTIGSAIQSLGKMGFIKERLPTSKETSDQGPAMPLPAYRLDQRSDAGLTKQSCAVGRTLGSHERRRWLGRRPIESGEPGDSVMETRGLILVMIRFRKLSEGSLQQQQRSLSADLNDRAHSDFSRRTSHATSSADSEVLPTW